MTTQKPVGGRRQVLVGAGAAALGGLVVGPALLRRAAHDGHAVAELPEPALAEDRRAEGGAQPAQLAPADDDVRALFGPLREGSAISTHWRIESLHAARAGAIPLVMSTIDGRRFAVEVFRGDPQGSQPIARAGSLALHLVNQGDGSSRTDELTGLGVMALARALEARLSAGAPIPNALGTHRERTARHPLGSFDVPV